MLLALFGGALIGLSASLAHAGARQTVGVSGSVGGLLRWPLGRLGFADWFIVGLVVGGFLIARVAPGLTLPGLAPRPVLLLLISGLLVGFGTRLGNGCTSGHGVCGLSRLSLRSLIATCTFMATAAFVVLLVRHVFAAWRPM